MAEKEAKARIKINKLFEEAGWRFFDEGLRILRPYQSKAIHALQAWAKEEKDRFLFEMATGTGKTLFSAALFWKTL